MAVAVHLPTELIQVWLCVCARVCLYLKNSLHFVHFSLQHTNSFFKWSASWPLQFVMCFIYIEALRKARTGVKGGSERKGFWWIQPQTTGSVHMCCSPGYQWLNEAIEMGNVPQCLDAFWQVGEKKLCGLYGWKLPWENTVGCSCWQYGWTPLLLLLLNVGCLFWLLLTGLLLDRHVKTGMQTDVLLLRYFADILAHSQC